MTTSPRLVTVDGPAGSGKSTLGRRLAATLGLPFIDTGLFYRALLVAALRAGVPSDDGRALAALARSSRLEVNVDPQADEGDWLVRIDGVEVGAELRDPQHAAALSRLSALRSVRDALLQPQRAMARRGGVAAGRDCGTVVFPEAPVKLYLDAPPSVRQQRRAAQLGRAGVTDRAALDDEIGGRDAIDSLRAAAPMHAAPDARVIDTGELDIEEMVELALRLCAEADPLQAPAE